MHFKGEKRTRGTKFTWHLTYKIPTDLQGNGESWNRRWCLSMRSKREATNMTGMQASLYQRTNSWREKGHQHIFFWGGAVEAKHSSTNNRWHFLVSFSNLLTAQSWTQRCHASNGKRSVLRLSGHRWRSPQGKGVIATLGRLQPVSVGLLSSVPAFEWRQSWRGPFQVSLARKRVPDFHPTPRPTPLLPLPHSTLKKSGNDYMHSLWNASFGHRFGNPNDSPLKMCSDTCFSVWWTK